MAFIAGAFFSLFFLAMKPVNGRRTLLSSCVFPAECICANMHVWVCAYISKEPLRPQFTWQSDGNYLAALF